MLKVVTKADAPLLLRGLRPAREKRSAQGSLLRVKLMPRELDFREMGATGARLSWSGRHRSSPFVEWAPSELAFRGKDAMGAPGQPGAAIRAAERGGCGSVHRPVHRPEALDWRCRSGGSSIWAIQIRRRLQMGATNPAEAPHGHCKSGGSSRWALQIRRKLHMGAADPAEAPHGRYRSGGSSRWALQIRRKLQMGAAVMHGNAQSSPGTPGTTMWTVMPNHRPVHRTPRC